MAEADFESLINKLNFTPVDSKDFLNLLFQKDEKGYDYLSSLKKEFKEKYVIPTYKKAQELYSNLKTNIDNAKKDTELANAITDPLDIVNLRKEYKEKAKTIFEEKLKRVSDIKINPEEQKTTVNEKITASNIVSTTAPAVANRILTQPDQNTAQEQATFTEKEKKVSLSDDTLEKLKDLLNVNVNVKKEEKTEEKEKSSLLKTLGSLLAIGGLGAVLIATFWDDKIKPWLEKKFNINLDFFDKFEGIVEGIGKFFTMGGLKITAGPLFTLVGKAFTTFGDLLEGGLKAIFKLGFGDEVVEQGAKAGGSVFKNLLPKIAGGLFKGVGATFLKGIPVIGSLISFYFAYDRYQKSDYIGAVIDLVGGLANLLEFTPLAPLALPISLGAAALNAFLDYKTGDLPDAQRGSAKLNILGGLSQKIYNALKDIPFIGGLLKFGYGIYELASGDFMKGLDLLAEQPFLGPFPALIKSIVNSTQENPDGSKSFSFDKFKSELKMNMFKWIISMVPNMWGLRGKIASIMGINYDDTTGDVKLSDDPYNLNSINEQEKIRKEGVSKLSTLPKGTNYDPKVEEDLLKKIKEIKEKNKKLQEEYEKAQEGSMRIGDIETNPFHDAYAEDSARISLESSQDIYSGLLKRLEEYRKLKKDVVGMGPDEANEQYDRAKEKFDDVVRTVADQYKERKPSIKVQDFYKPADGTSSLIQTPNQIYKTDPSDDVLALKKDGVLEKNFQRLSNVMESVNRGIYKVYDQLNSNTSKQNNPINVISGGNAKNMPADVAISGARDSIYEMRAMWWRRSINFREST